jgi:hypothetical protein|tara:strand:+ start:1529 stop:1966 length:438 start_codon:yes stop_codon:yes gene_type:complete
MTLKELQTMIKEEFAAYHEADDVDVSVSDADVDVDAEMGDDMGDEEGSDEDILRNIYDMLKSKFEGEGEMDDMTDDMGDEEMPMDDVEGEDEDSDLDELANHGVGKSAKNSSGPNAGMTPAKTTKGDGKLHESVKRFQKLANIIK